MGLFFDNWAWAHRNARAWGMVIVLVLGGLLTWALWATRVERVDVRETSGELLEVMGNNQGGLYVGRVRVDDGREIKVFLPQQTPPKAGDRVPLIVERYDDGKMMYVFDNTKWVADGGLSP